MLSSVVLSNFITMPVLDASFDAPFFIRNVEGLGPVDAEVNTIGYGVIDGETPVGSSVGKRNIVLTIGLNDPVQDNRDLLYFWAMPKAAVQLKFTFDDKAAVVIDGIVESNHPNHFSNDPEVQISVICPRPEFRSEELFVVTGDAGISPADTIINYNGNLIAGFDVELVIGGTSYGPGATVAVDFDHDFTGLPPGEYRSLTLSDISIASGRKVVFNTRPGLKRLESQPVSGSGVVNNLLYALTNDSFWLTLWPGDNHIRVRTNESDIARDWTLKYSELFGGI